VDPKGRRPLGPIPSTVSPQRLRCIQGAPPASRPSTTPTRSTALSEDHFEGCGNTSACSGSAKPNHSSLSARSPHEHVQAPDFAREPFENKRCHGLRRQILCNVGGGLGKRNLLMVSPGSDPLRPPYNLCVQYDLRPVAHTFTDDDRLYLAALDVEKLRRKGNGRGLDVMQASESWLARDCLCSKSGKLRTLPSRNGPGQVNIALSPCRTAGLTETVVMLRVIAARLSDNPHDWHVVGSAVVLRVDLVGKLQQQVPPEQQWQSAARGPTEAEAPDESFSGNCGLRVQQLIDFYDDIREDMEKYCRVHRLCVHQHSHRFHHVCMLTPCPYRPMNFSRYDDHRGIPFVPYSALRYDEPQHLTELAADMHLVVARYIKPMTKHTGKGQVALMNPKKPLKFAAFITHAWSEHISDFVETVGNALDGDDVVFISAFSVDQHSSLKDDGHIDLEDSACGKALAMADKVIVVVDKASAIMRRLWCNYEILKAKELHRPTFVWPHKEADAVALRIAVDAIDISASAASEPSDEAALRNELHDFTMNEQTLKSFLHTRLSVFAETLQQVSDFQDFSPAKMRLLHAERERGVTLKEIEQETNQLLTVRNNEVAKLAHSKMTTERQLAIEAIEMRSRLQQEEELEDIRAKSMAELEQQLVESQRALKRAQDHLEEERTKTASLERAWQEERVRLEKEAQQRVDEKSRYASEEAQRFAEETKRVVEEHRTLIEAQESRHGEEVARMGQHCIEMDDALQRAQIDVVGLERDLAEVRAELAKEREAMKRGQQENDGNDAIGVGEEGVSEDGTYSAAMSCRSMDTTPSTNSNVLGKIAGSATALASSAGKLTTKTGRKIRNIGLKFGFGGHSRGDLHEACDEGRDGRQQGEKPKKGKFLTAPSH